MSEHKTFFESDVESLDISEDFVLVGLNNGSVACISLKVNVCCSIIHDINIMNKLSYSISQGLNLLCYFL